MELPEYINISPCPADMLGNIIGQIKPTKIFLITDTNVHKYCYSLISENIPPHNVVTILPGEDQKNLQTCIDIWKAMTDACLDRHSVVINLGGGVICDMGGFCASVYKRGLSFIHCPTTLLSQVDASIGGKLGIDFENYKNQIGAFNNPNYVILSNAFLKTLPLNELRCGYAEMIKHALINSVEDWEKQLSMDLSEIPSEEQIINSISIKYQVVLQDPKETGVRKALNFGHTIGHAVESILLDGKQISITHGDAVVVGLIAESWLSYKCLGLKKSELHSICSYITNYYPEIELNGISEQDFFNALLQDKKNIGNRILPSLIKSIGECIVSVSVSAESCLEALNFYRTIYK